jgi:type VI secretion system FHA domain protein
MAKTLRLTAISYGGKPQSGLAARLGSGRLAIGRGTDNDWVLADPERHLSSQHCTVEEHNGRYAITDVSRNGVFVNGAEKPLGQGCSYPLDNGDRIIIGDYELAVEIETAPTMAAALPVFGGVGAPSVGAINGSGAQDPFSSPIESIVAPKSAPESLAVWISDKSHGSQFNAFPPAVGPAPRLTTPEGDHRWGPDPDHVPAVNSFFQVPGIKPPVIPPDWNALSTDVEPTPQPGTDAVVFSPMPAPELPQPPTPSGLTVKPHQTGGLPSEAVAQPTIDALAGEALKAFLDGAGLPDAPIGSVDSVACLRGYGELLRELTSGIRELLFARAEMKSEFRIQQTVIRAADNNPLKFSVDLEQALLALLLPRRTGYAPPLAAVREAIADLRAHELGMIAGMQKASAKLLAALAPEALERRIEAAGLLASVVPATRKARCWEAYERAYHEVAAALEEDVQGMFREAFAAAYSEQANKL